MTGRLALSFFASHREGQLHYFFWIASLSFLTSTSGSTCNTSLFSSTHDFHPRTLFTSVFFWKERDIENRTTTQKGQIIADRRRRASQSAQEPDALGPGVTQPVQRDAQEELNRDNEAEETGKVCVDLHRSALEPGPGACTSTRAGGWTLGNQHQAAGKGSRITGSWSGLTLYM